VILPVTSRTEKPLQLHLASALRHPTRALVGTMLGSVLETIERTAGTPMPPTVAKTSVTTPIDAAAKLGVDKVGHLGLFRGANGNEVAVLLQSCPVRSQATGDILVRAGESCAALCIVLSGSLRAKDPSSTVPDTFIKAGESSGELFLFEDAAVARTVSATAPTRLLVFDASAAWGLVNSSHAVARNLLKLLVERTRPGTRSLQAASCAHLTSVMPRLMKVPVCAT